MVGIVIIIIHLIFSKCHKNFSMNISKYAKVQSCFYKYANHEDFARVHIQEGSWRSNRKKKCRDSDTSFMKKESERGKVEKHLSHCSFQLSCCIWFVLLKCTKDTSSAKEYDRRNQNFRFKTRLPLLRVLIITSILEYRPSRLLFVSINM